MNISDFKAEVPAKKEFVQKAGSEGNWILSAIAFEEQEEINDFFTYELVRGNQKNSFRYYLPYFFTPKLEENASEEDIEKKLSLAVIKDTNIFKAIHWQYMQTVCTKEGFDEAFKDAWDNCLGKEISTEDVKECIKCFYWNCLINLSKIVEETPLKEKGKLFLFSDWVKDKKGAYRLKPSRPDFLVTRKVFTKEKEGGKNKYITYPSDIQVLPTDAVESYYRDFNPYNETTNVQFTIRKDKHQETYLSGLKPDYKGNQLTMELPVDSDVDLDSMEEDM